MTKRILLVAMALSVVFAGKMWAEDSAAPVKKAKPVKTPKVVETRLSEHDMNQLERSITKAVASKQGTGSWEYTAQKLKPPKNEKWVDRWNELGKNGWEMIDHFENVYIFKRPAVLGMTSKAAEPVVAPVETPEEIKKDDKAQERAIKDADRQKEKAAKDAEKAAKKAQKKQEKAAKKAQKEADKVAKKAAKEAAKTRE